MFHSFFFIQLYSFFLYSRQLYIFKYNDPIYTVNIYIINMLKIFIIIIMTSNVLSDVLFIKKFI